MSSLSTFGAFTTARLGIYSSTKWLDVIGNNISNINTEGYTRQSVDQISLYMGAADKYRTGYDARVGNGGLVTRITQLRDPYIDIRYRNEISSVGAMDAKLGGLQQISSILDEVAYGEDEDGNLGVMELQFNDLISQMQRLVDEGAGEDTFDTNVRTSAASLCALFNSYASRLEELRENQEEGLVQDIGTVNDILVGIRDLSDSIRKANIYGGDALEQKDARNLLIDQLAEYVRIDVKYELEEIAPGQTVEKLVINLNGNDTSDVSTNKMTLVDGIYCAQLSIDHPVTDPSGTAKYLDDEGLPTDSINKAKREFNDYYQVVVSTLKDRWNSPMDLPYPAEKSVVDRVASAGIKAGLTPDEDTDGNGTPDAVSDGAWKAALEALLADKETYPDSAIVSGVRVKYSYEAAQVRYTDGTTGYEIIRTATGYAPTTLTDNTLYGAIQAERELLTEQGEYATAEQIAMDRNANVKRGILYYQKALDTLANQFAATMNEANTVRGGHLMESAADTAADVVYPGDYFLTKDGDGNDIYVTLQTENGYLKTGAGIYCNLGNVTFAGLTTPEDKTAHLNGIGVDDDVLAELGYEGYDELITDLEEDPNLLLKVSGDGTLTSLQKQHLLPTELGGMGHGSYETVELPEGYEQPNDGPLFSNHGSSDSTGVPYDPNHPETAQDGPITAATISVSKSWGEGSVRIQQSTDPLHPTTDNTNLYHILNLLQVEHHEYTPLAADLKDSQTYADPKDLPDTGAVTFKGSFQRMFTDNICGKLASDVQNTTTMLNNYSTAADELYVDRDAVMGVDLNDETINMMQVQKSLTAAYRLMTVVDDMLDRLINNMAV